MSSARKAAAEAQENTIDRPTGGPQAQPREASPAAGSNRKAEAGEEQGDSPRENSQENQQAEEGATSPAEGITLAISVAILLGVVGLLIYLYVTGGDRPAAIQVRPVMQELRQEGELYYLPVEIHNAGDHTASSLEVELSLSTPGGETETSQFSIQFLSGQDTQRAVATFHQDPRKGELTTSISFIEP